MEKNTAILIFAKSVVAECSSKRFVSNKAFFKNQQDRLISLCSKTGLDVLNFDETKQIGDTFGERFCNSVSEVFCKGYNNLIILGNDTPQLNYSHLEAAIKSLKSGNSCIGKNVDGGFYLLALSKHCFKYSEFVEFSWNSSKVTSELIQTLEFKVNINFIPTLKDIDSEKDLISLQNFTKNLYSALISILKNTLLAQAQNFKIPSLNFDKILVASHQNKAPPFYQF